MNADAVRGQRHEGVVVVEHVRHDDLFALGGTYAGLYWTSQVARPELQGSHHTQLTGANLAWRAH